MSKTYPTNNNAMAKKEEHKQTNNSTQDTTQKTKDLATRTPPKTGG